MNYMQNMKNINDRRVMKTKKSIQEAFEKLLGEKDFRSITVTDIAKMADVNRKTFYNYYQGVDDVMKEMIDNILAKMFGENLNDLDFEWFLKNPDELFHRLTALMDEDFDFYMILFKSEEPGNLLQKIELLIKEKMTAYFIEKDPENTLNTILICEYCTSGMIAAYRYWFNSGCVIPLEELSRRVCLMTQNCIETLASESVSEK